MTASLIDGKQIATEIRAEIRERVALLKQERQIIPGLGVLLVGDDPASRSYVTAKERACEEAGIYSMEVKLDADAALEEILAVVDQFNEDDRVHGILVQLPLPNSAWEKQVIERIDPNKDVDGFHPVNVGRMMLGHPCFLPCTPHGILHLLKRTTSQVGGADIVVVGRSNIVGRPLANLLSLKSDLGNATVTLCHTGTLDIGAHTERADIVIAAAGRPNTITADMVKEGAIVIDVGVNRVPDESKKSGYRLVGDVDFDGVSEKAAAITPVPGGVGPMTIAMLLHNTVEASMGLGA